MLRTHTDGAMGVAYTQQKSQCLTVRSWIANHSGWKWRTVKEMRCVQCDKRGRCGLARRDASLRLWCVILSAFPPTNYRGTYLSHATESRWIDVKFAAVIATQMASCRDIIQGIILQRVVICTGNDTMTARCTYWAANLEGNHESDNRIQWRH